MEARLRLEILPQPDDTTCGPTCLHAVYRYFGDALELQQIIDEAHTLKEGGTLAVFLACHALRRGYDATIYTYNLEVFDPTWFESPDVSIAERLQRQAEIKTSHRIAVATGGYLDFLRLGGELKFEDLSTSLIRRYLKRGIPILTGLSATYLYHSAREIYTHMAEYDDLRGVPTGHFVVLGGYNKAHRSILIADPLYPNPMAPVQNYEVAIHRVVGAILLGILTHDANLLIITPRRKRTQRQHVGPDHRQ